MATILAGCAAAATTLPVVSQASPPPSTDGIRDLQDRVASAFADAEAEKWLALYREDGEAERIHFDALAVSDEAEFAARGSYPEQKSFLRVYSLDPLGDASDEYRIKTHPPLENVDRDQIDKWYDEQIAQRGAWKVPKLLQDYEENRTKSHAQFDKWEQACAEIDANYRVSELEAEAERARAVSRAAYDALLETPANSVAGIAVKLSRMVKSQVLNCSFKEEWSDVVDSILLVAWQDTLRLAGLPDDLGLEDHKAFVAERAAMSGEGDGAVSSAEEA